MSYLSGTAARVSFVANPGHIRGMLHISGKALDMTDEISTELIAELAPTGRLRAAINFGNAVLAQRDPAGGTPRGTSAELARELAGRLGVGIDYVTFDAAGKVFEALKAGLWDIAFLAIDPLRSAGIDFTAPYVVIEGTYLVPKDSPLHTIADVDRDGVRIAVAQGSAYDLYLTRTLQHAKLMRQPSGPEALEMFVSDRLEAAGGVRQPIVAFAQAHPDTRVIPGRFMAIEQAMGTVKGREAGIAYLRKFIEEMKASGFVAQALKASGQADAAVAPPA
ncbi:MAG TPA: ABC transporter substrate-binding protein [Xanthobacteraceae bacterium]|nr:ABC transporter substrate-binding protein [Xanthobacteraceae bacterium]